MSALEYSPCRTRWETKAVVISTSNSFECEVPCGSLGDTPASGCSWWSQKSRFFIPTTSG